MRPGAPPGRGSAKKHLIDIFLIDFEVPFRCHFSSKVDPKTTPKNDDIPDTTFSSFGMPGDLILEAFWKPKRDPVEKRKIIDFAWIYYVFERLGPSKIITFSHFFRYPEKVNLWTPFLSIFEANGLPLGLHFSSKSDLKTWPKNRGAVKATPVAPGAPTMTSFLPPNPPPTSEGGAKRQKETDSRRSAFRHWVAKETESAFGNYLVLDFPRKV